MVEPYGDVDVREAVKWIKAIRFEDWPQQSKVDDQLRPAMVTNLDWHDFRNIAVAIVKQLGFELSQPGTGMGHDDTYQWMLSCVMPGHGIEAHKDAQADYWKFRVHVPLLTNPKAFTEMEDGKHHLEVGKAYKVNTAAMHAVENGGRTPRVHFMFDVR
jgi:hypothetical protein